MSVETSVRIKILLVEDERSWRKDFQDALKSAPNIQVVATAENGQQALNYLMDDTIAINLVIMDYELDDNSLWGVELAVRILKKNPKMKMIFWSAHIAYMDVERAKRAGVHGYIQKTVPDEDAIDAIYEVMEDTGKWIEKLRTKSGLDPAIFNQLTSTEEKVMEILAEGKSYKQIASTFLEDEYEKEMEKHGLDWVLKKYGDLKKYSEGEPETQSADQAENPLSRVPPKIRTIAVELEIINKPVDSGKRKEEKKKELKYSRLKTKTKWVHGCIENIKKKLKKEIAGSNKIGMLLKIAIEQFRRLENKRENSFEELLRQEKLIMLGNYLDEKCTEQIAQEHGISEPEVEKIISELKLVMQEKYRKGVTAEQIANEYGIGKAGVEEIIREFSFDS